jgi:hypothetical protein
MNELLELYAGRASYGNNFGTGYFWSATEGSTYFARLVNFFIGTATNGNKSYSGYVRCVR